MKNDLSARLERAYQEQKAPSAAKAAEDQATRPSARKRATANPALFLVLSNLCAAVAGWSGWCLASGVGPLIVTALVLAGTVALTAVFGVIALTGATRNP